MAAKLARLSNRDDVKAALVLDRTTGAVLTATGDFASLLPATVNHIESSSSTVEDSLAADVVPATLSDTAASDGQRFAGTIWPFIGLAGSMIQDIDSEVRCTSSKPAPRHPLNVMMSRTSSNCYGCAPKSKRLLSFPMSNTS